MPHTLHRLNPEEAAAAAPQLAEVLLDCVAGGASVGFMADLDAARALLFWQGVAAGVARDERCLLVARETATGRIDGTVQLLLNLPDNQPHRGDVAKMLVHRRARRQGLAQALLGRLEAEAREAGRHLLVLDTVTGGDAERLYRRCGWQTAGVIPGYALMPDGAPCGTTYLYKAL